MLHSTSVNLTCEVKIYFMTSQCIILEYILEGCTHICTFDLLAVVNSSNTLFGLFIMFLKTASKFYRFQITDRLFNPAPTKQWNVQE